MRSSPSPLGPDRPRVRPPAYGRGVISFFALVTVLAWTALGALAWVGGRGARRVERWVGMVFVGAVLIPIYLFGDDGALMAVADEMTKPIVEMVTQSSR